MTATYQKHIDSNGTATPASDGFSWKRVGELYAYHGPVIKKQCAIYLAISALCAILMLLPAREMIQVALFTAIWTVLPYMYFLSPLVFARQSVTPAIERMIPAKAQEKLAFYLTYLLLILPITVYALPILAEYLYGQMPSIQTPHMMEMYKIRLDVPAGIFTVNLLTGIGCLLTCLWVIKSVRTNRILKGVLSVIGVQTVLGMIGGIYGFRMGMKDAALNLPQKDGAEFTQIILDQMNQADGLMITLYILLALYCAISVWLIYRSLRHKNL